MSQGPEFLTFATRSDACDALANRIAAQLDGPTSSTLMLSGGTSPEPAYRTLFAKSLGWDRVTIGLVDDRWVDPDHMASNQALVVRTQAGTPAERAAFLPMKTSAETPQAAERDVDRLYHSAKRPFDAVVLGMGPDGHTASWFPGSTPLNDVLDPDAQALVRAMDATGAPVAGDHTQRMTLTLSAIADARFAGLLIFGGDKRAVFERALGANPQELPIAAAIAALGDRLAVFWSD